MQESFSAMMQAECGHSTAEWKKGGGRMNRVRASVWMLVITLLAVGMMMFVPGMLHSRQITERQVGVEVCRVEQGNIEQIIALTGAIRYEGEHAAISPVMGMVETIYVQEGDPVRQGQPLLRLESSVQEAMVTQTLQQGMELPSFKENDVIDPTVIGAVVEKEQASTLKQAFAVMDAMTIRAATDGIVQQIAVSEHSGVATGGVCVVMSGLEQRIECRAVVKDAAQISNGMRVRILYDDEAVSEGVVASIGPAVTENGQAVCAVELIPDNRIDLPLGAVVTAEVICSEAKNVPLLPVSAVAEDQSVRWIAAERAYEIPVTVLMSNEVNCWVDLPVGTEVVLRGEATADGQRIREAQR